MSLLLFGVQQGLELLNSDVFFIRVTLKTDDFVLERLDSQGYLFRAFLLILLGQQSVVVGIR